MPPTIVHLFYVFGERRSALMGRFIAAGYVVASLLVLANFAGLLVSGVRPHTWGFYPIARPLYGVHVGSVVINFAVAIYLLVTNVTRAPTPYRRLQAKFWLMGAGIGIVGGITNLLPVYQFQVYPVGNLANVPYTAIVAYAIIRHRLVDFDTVVVRFVSYGLVGLGLLLPAFTCVLWLQYWAFGSIHIGFSVATFVLFVVVGTSFPVFRIWTERRVTRSLFKQKEEYRDALREFTKQVVRILDREALVGTLVRVLEEALRVPRVSLYLRDNDVFREENPTADGTDVDELAADDVLVEWLGSRNGAVVRDEVGGERDARVRRLIDRGFGERGWEACVPISLSGELIGFVGLGRKSGLETYAGADLGLLDALAAEVAIALENARLYQQLRSSQEVIRRAGKLSAIGTLAAGIAHEIRNPLVSIQTFFQLAPQRLDDEEFMTEFLSITESEVQRICSLITELLSFAKSPERQARYVDLDEVVGGVLRLLSPQARKRGISLEFQGGGAGGVHGDEDQLKQVLVNLVLNAIEAIEEKGRVQVSTSRVAGEKGEFWQVGIRDDGVGIPAELREEIFNPFFTTKTKGTGLGLAVSNQIVGEHGGFIEIEEAGGRGTSILVHLPAGSRRPEETDAELSADAPAHLGVAVFGRGKTC